MGIATGKLPPTLLRTHSPGIWTLHYRHQYLDTLTDQHRNADYRTIA
jgi:hypothetical protein